MSRLVNVIVAKWSDVIDILPVNDAVDVVVIDKHAHGLRALNDARYLLARFSRRFLRSRLTRRWCQAQAVTCAARWMPGRTSAGNVHMRGMARLERPRSATNRLRRSVPGFGRL